METWGLKPGQVGGPPADCKLWWGARAIYNGSRDQYHVDVLWDRQGMTGDDEKARKELSNWLDKKGLKGLKARLKADAVYPGDNILVSFEEGGYVINANPNRSHGYLYICAFKKVWIVLTLKSKTESFIVVDYNDLDKFVQETTGVKDYEFMAAEEGPKDGHKAYRVTGEVDSYDQKRFEKFKAGKEHSFITQTILDTLCKDKLIPPGHYLIACFW